MKKTMLIPMYWVLISGTEETVAICKDKKCAEWIAENFPKECIIRITFN